MALDGLFEEMVNQAWVEELIRAAVREDLGDYGDITSNALVPNDLKSRAIFRSREEGFISGLALLPLIKSHYGEGLEINLLAEDGYFASPGTDLAEISGPLVEILQAERVMLNFLGRLSGIATLTGQYVAAAGDYEAEIFDTRKTTPGWRELEKYAVRCGGGQSHRMGLYDAVLVKDNHIAHIPIDELEEALSAAIAAAREQSPAPEFIEIEVDTLEQLQQVLKCDVDIVLLDNMSNDQMTQAVTMRDDLAPAVSLEASGGVNLESVNGIAATGVDRIAVGALTHSATCLDIGLDID